ncbi:MAG: hypothetical protein ABJC09_10055 [Terriglobia bacterium]
MSKYIVQEITVRETGESAVFYLGDICPQNLQLTLGITHALEQESMDVDVFGSRDGRQWSEAPLLSFKQKFFCGTYQMELLRSDARFLKAVWRVDRWGRNVSRPFFRFYLSADVARARVMAGAA